MSYYRRGSRSVGRQEVGAALIVAIFVMTVAVSMMVALSMDSILAARRAENQLLADQAWYYLVGAEQLAGEMIRQRLQEIDEDKDAADKLHVLDVVGQFPTDDGWLAFEVEDLQGRFNLNSLPASFAPGKKPPQDENQAPLTPLPEAPLAANVNADGDIVRSISQQRFIRLLRTVGEAPLSEAAAVEVLEAVLDWLDTDALESGFGGAEQAYYAEQVVPYRPGDGPLRDVSELRLIKGVSAQLYNSLRPLVTVWPVTGGSINVAAAGPNLLQALYHDPDQLADPLEPESAKVLFEALQDQQITTLEELRNRPEWGPEPLLAEALVNRSEVFLVSAQVQVGRLLQGMQSVLLVTDNKTQILARNLTML